jgi:hypothetical protein
VECPRCRLLNMPGSVSCFGCSAPLVEAAPAPVASSARAPRIELEPPEAVDEGARVDSAPGSEPGRPSSARPPPDVRAFLPPLDAAARREGLAASLTRRRARASSSRHVETILDASDVRAGLVGLVPGLPAARAGDTRIALAFAGAALGALLLAGYGLWARSMLLELGLAIAAIVCVASMTHTTATHALASTRLRDADDQARAWWASAMFAIAVGLGLFASARLVLSTQVDVVVLPALLAAELGDEALWTRRGGEPTVGARRITSDGLVEVLAVPGEAWRAEGGVVTTPRGALAVRTHPLVAEVGSHPSAALDTAVRAPTLIGHGTVAPGHWLVLERALLSDRTLLLRVRELPARALGAPLLVSAPPARRRLLDGTYP